MSFEERMDRLAERHVALAQAVELMAQMSVETQRKNEALMAQVIESIDSLARIAHAHERRISDLEDHM